MASSLTDSLTPLLESADCKVKLKVEVFGDVAAKLGETIKKTEEERAGEDLEPLTFRPVRMPMKFTSVEEEVNFIVILSLLDFCSFYDQAMKDATGRNVHNTLRMGCMGLFITNTKLDASFLLNASIDSVARAFSFPVTKEVKIMEAVYQDEAGPLQPLAERIKRTFNEVGKVLRARQLDSLGQFVMKSVTHSTFKHSATALVQSLVDSFAGFRDSVEVNGVSYDFSRKASQAATDLYLRFASEDDRFDFKDMDQIPMSADSKLVYVLRQLGLLELEEKMREKIDEKREEVESSSTDEFYLRACALCASQKLLGELKGVGINLAFYQLDSALRIAILENGKVMDESVHEHMTKSYHY